MPTNPPVLALIRRSTCAVLTSLAVASVQFLTPGLAAAQTVDLTMSAASDRDGESTSVRSAVSGTVGVGRAAEAEQLADDAGNVVSFYRGFERDAVDEIGLEVSGELMHSKASGERSTDFFLSERGYAELFGWRIEQTLSYQSPPRFSDVYWRSSRELASVSAEGTVPPMFAVGHPRTFLF